MDTAIVRGRVVKTPEFVRNDNVDRCVFVLGIELSNKLLPDVGQKDIETTCYTTMTAVTEPELTPRCEALLTVGDDVLVTGQFGVIKGKLKMRVTNIDLPPIDASTLPVS